MYEVLIEVKDEEFEEFKVDQLTEKLSETKFVVEEEETVKFYSKYFKLSSEIKFIDSDSKNLSIALKILKKQVKGTDGYENALIQLGYFENRFYCKLIKKTLREISKKGPKSINCSCLKVLKKLTKSVAIFKVEEDVSKGFNLVCRLLWNLSNIFNNNDQLDVSKNASEGLEIIKIIKLTFDSKKLKIFEIVLRCKKYLIPILNSFLVKKAIYSFKEPAPIPPKPSFYDMAFDCLTYEIEKDIKQSSTSTPTSTSTSTAFSNLLSGFWGAKK